MLGKQILFEKFDQARCVRLVGDQASHVPGEDKHIILDEAILRDVAGVLYLCGHPLPEVGHLPLNNV